MDLVTILPTHLIPYIIPFFPFLSVLVSVILSASVERFSVCRIFLKSFSIWETKMDVQACNVSYIIGEGMIPTDLPHLVLI